MAKVGYRKPYYKLLGAESTAEAKSAGMGVRCEVTINAPETKLYADDGVAESVREFVDGSITAEFDDISPDVMADLTGAKAGTGNELIFNADDVPPFVRFGYINKRIKKQSGVVARHDVLQGAVLHARRQQRDKGTEHDL